MTTIKISEKLITIEKNGRMKYIDKPKFGEIVLQFQEGEIKFIDTKEKIKI